MGRWVGMPSGHLLFVLPLLEMQILIRLECVDVALPVLSFRSKLSY